MADQSRSRQAPVICVLETDLPGGQYGMAEEFKEKLIEKVWEYVFLYDTGHLEYKNLVKNASHSFLASTTVSFHFYNSVLTEEEEEEEEEEVLLHQNWTS
jgi:hypothetical protein